MKSKEERSGWSYFCELFGKTILAIIVFFATPFLVFQGIMWFPFPPGEEQRQLATLTAMFCWMVLGTPFAISVMSSQFAEWFFGKTKRRF